MDNLPQYEFAVGDLLSLGLWIYFLLNQIFRLILDPVFICMVDFEHV